MDLVLRRGINLRTRICDYTYDRGPGLSLIKTDPLTDWILGRPVAAGQGLIDDRDGRRLLRIAGVESATAQQRLSDSLEIIFTADEEEPGCRGRSWLRVAVLDREDRRAARQAIQRNGPGNGDRFDAGQRANLAHAAFPEAEAFL